MTDPAIITIVGLIVTIVLAFIGYIATYANNVLIETRRKRIERLDRQINDFFGPLFALNEAGKEARRYFRSHIRGGNESIWRGERPPTAEEASEWRLWMKEVFIPLNLKMEDIILKNLALLDEEMPLCAKELSAHTAAYKPLLKLWDDEAFENLPLRLVNQRSQS